MFAAKNELFTSPSGYQISRSVRLRSSASAYFNRTPAGAGTSNKTFTYSAWVKRGSLGSIQNLISSPNTGNSDSLRFSAADALEYNWQDTVVGQVTTTQVFRDPSAWYHIMFAMDTTQATASNRFKLYVNGVQVTAFSTANYPAQNTVVNNTAAVATKLGQYANSSTQNFDGYLTEVNFIDGQALTPSSFGENDTITGVWKPKKYTGTYGTNGFYLNFSDNSNNTAATIGKDYSGNGNNWTPNNISLTSGSFTSLTASSGTYTVPAGVTSLQYLVVGGGGGGGSFGGGGGAGGVVAGSMTVTPGQTISYTVGAGGSGAANTSTPGGNGGDSTFGAITATGGGGGGSSSGQTPTTGGSGGGGSSYQSSGASGTTGQGFAGGRGYTNSATYWNSGGGGGATANGGDGLIVTGNTQGGGSGGAGYTWMNGSTYGGGGGGGGYGANGGPGGSGGGGYGGGDFTTATSGSANTGGGGGGGKNGGAGASGGTGVIVIGIGGATTYDSMIDVPTNWADGGNGRGNYAVLNPLFAAGTVADGNLKHTASTTTWVNTSSTIFVNSGKWYFEATNIAGNYTMIGVATNSASTSQNYGTATNTWTYFNDGTKYGNGATATAYGASYTTGNVIGVALDMDAGTLTFYKDGVSQGTAFSTGLAGLSLCPWFGSYTSGNGVNVNFGQRPFAYTPPSGFKALNTQNLPAPTISNGALYMNATTYSGTTGVQAVTNSGGMQPDLVWIKVRNIVANHVLQDSVRGTTAYLQSNVTTAENTNTSYDWFRSFNSNGFTVASSTTGGTPTSEWNTSGNTYVGWQWQAGKGTTSSNTSGSITSTVSVNATAGFSVVTFTSPSSGTFTVGHGLGVAPKMVIIKDRGQIGSWSVYHASATTNSQYLLLNSTAAVGSSTNYFGTAIPSSTVFGANAGVSVQTSDTCVAYCFSAVAGYSAFGSYTGNGSATGDGPFVYLGFRPRWLLLKVSSAAGYDWLLYDSSRDTYNVTNLNLRPDLSDAEGSQSANYLDFLSNGFKIRGTSSGSINPSQTIIYAAFAENPYKVALAR